MNVNFFASPPTNGYEFEIGFISDRIILLVVCSFYCIFARK